MTNIKSIRSPILRYQTTPIRGKPKWMQSRWAGNQLITLCLVWFDDKWNDLLFSWCSSTKKTCTYLWLRLVCHHSSRVYIISSLVRGMYYQIDFALFYVTYRNKWLWKLPAKPADMKQKMTSIGELSGMRKTTAKLTEKKSEDTTVDEQVVFDQVKSYIKTCLILQFLRLSYRIIEASIHLSRI